MRKILFPALCFLLYLNTATAHPGIGIVMDSKGNVYYTDLSHVWKISPKGTRTIAVRNVHTHELFLDARDNLYGEHEWYKGEASDTWGNYVWKLSSEGELTKTIPDVEGFLDNNTLVRDPDGNSYWPAGSGDHEILNKENLKGEVTRFTPHLFRDIRWMYFSEFDNNLYVVDHLNICKVSAGGKVTTIAEGLKESAPPFEGVADHHYIFGLWMDPQTNLYAAVYGAGKVKKIDPEGRITTVYESEQGWSPCGGLIGPDGTQWILEFSDTNNTRVKKISPGGEQRVFEE